MMRVLVIIISLESGAGNRAAYSPNGEYYSSCRNASARCALMEPYMIVKRPIISALPRNSQASELVVDKKEKQRDMLQRRRRAEQEI